MSGPDKAYLQQRVDDFSYQVYTPADRNFWFRLVREHDRDVITDYFIGSFPKECAGYLLADCYHLIGLTPKRVVVFKDIFLSKMPDDPKTLDEVRTAYASYGTILLTQFGASKIDEYLERETDKHNLVLVNAS